MDIKQILKIEKENFDKIYIFYEGAHWRIYERSALQWVRAVRACTVKRRFYKVAKGELAVLGIPIAMLDRYLHRTNLPVKVIERGEGLVVVKVRQKLKEDAFQAWKSSLEMYIPPSKIIRMVRIDNPVFQQIEEFDAAYATPMEALYFARNIKRHLAFIKA
jgi:hypothetical protein